MSKDEAVRYMRGEQRYAELIRDSYLGADTLESARRFERSAEFVEVLKLVGTTLGGGKVLDIGAGAGIASWAFAATGAACVYALEPDPSEVIGRGALERLVGDMPVAPLDARAEEIPLPDEEVDVVYLRQVLHHVSDLQPALRECARVLKTGGVLLACREHVVDDEEQLRVFLGRHPVHRLIGGEGAHRLGDYTGAIRAAGLRLEGALGPWDSVINAFPTVTSADELERFPHAYLERRLGDLGRLLSRVPGVEALIWRRLKRPDPGRLYTFLAVKP